MVVKLGRFREIECRHDPFKALIIAHAQRPRAVALHRPGGEPRSGTLAAARTSRPIGGSARAEQLDLRARMGDAEKSRSTSRPDPSAAATTAGGETVMVKAPGIEPLPGTEAPAGGGLRPSRAGILQSPSNCAPSFSTRLGVVTCNGARGGQQLDPFARDNLAVHRPATVSRVPAIAWPSPPRPRRSEFRRR